MKKKRKAVVVDVPVDILSLPFFVKKEPKKEQLSIWVDELLSGKNEVFDAHPPESFTGTKKVYATLSPESSPTEPSTSGQLFNLSLVELESHVSTEMHNHQFYSKVQSLHKNVPFEISKKLYNSKKHSIVIKNI